MGYNTVFFSLNDHMRDALKSPRAYAYLIAYGDLYANDAYRDDILNEANIIARENGEPPVNDYALKGIKCFHADNVQFFRAGRNSMEALEYDGLITKKDRNGQEYECVVLRLPKR